MDGATRSRALRRRNGRLQACDPCRSRKVACDHGQPVCERCRRRKQEAQCAYTIDTVSTQRTAPTPPPGLPQQQRRRRRHEQYAEDPQVFESFRDPVAPTSSSTDLVADAGFLGFTNPTTVYRETRQSLSLLRGPAPGRVADAGGRRFVAKDTRFSVLSPRLRESCLIVLGRLPGMPASPMHVVGDAAEQPGSWEGYMVASIIRFLRSRFGAKTPRDADIERLADLINGNTMRPLRDIHSSSKEWLDQFCGANLRWESLGLMWAHLERLSDALTSLRTISLQWLPGERSEHLAMECMTSCLHLAQHFSQGNDLFVDLCRRICSLESMITGDACR